MNWMAQHWLALALLVGYTGALLYNAYLGSQASRGMAGYYVGNREMSGIVVGISFFATFASTNTYIGHAGKAYDYGVAWFTMAILLVVFSWVSWRWIGPPLRRFAAQWDALTIPDFWAVDTSTARISRADMRYCKRRPSSSFLRACFTC